MISFLIPKAEAEPRLRRIIKPSASATILDIIGCFCELDLNFLNQACAGLRPACTWYLKIDPVQIVGVCACVYVCVSAPEAINN